MGKNQQICAAIKFSRNFLTFYNPKTPLKWNQIMHIFSKELNTEVQKFAVGLQMNGKILQIVSAVCVFYETFVTYKIRATKPQNFGHLLKVA